MWMKELKDLAANNLIIFFLFAAFVGILFFTGTFGHILPLTAAAFQMVGLVLVTCLLMGALRSDLFEGYVFMSHHKFIDLLEEWEHDKAKDRSGKRESHDAAEVMRALALKSQGNIQLFAVLLTVMTVLFLAALWMGK